MTITLQGVTEHNVDVIIELPLLPEQQDYLASNAYSIAQAVFIPTASSSAPFMPTTSRSAS